MKNKIIIFIGEGNSEISFFQEFIKNRYNIEGENIKTNILFEINNHFIIFSHPKLGSEEHKGGNNKFKLPLTYIDINKRIKSSAYAFKDADYEFIYLYLTDKDKTNSEEYVEGVEVLFGKFCKDFDGSKKVIWAIKEIETWFMAGIGNDFKEKYPEYNKIVLDEFYKKDIEKENNTKELLTDIILNGTSIYGTSQQSIGREFGKLIDIEQAKQKSPSFKKFIETIDNILK